jgi:hypothetical protein
MRKSLKLRRPTVQDVPAIEKIAEKFDFILPEKFETATVVVDEDDVVQAFGLTRLIVESVIVTGGTPREIVEQTELLIQQGIEDVKSSEHNGMHVFVENEAFARLLKERFDFQKAKGEALVSKVR